MSYVGLWKLGSMMSFDPEKGRVWLTAEEYAAMPIEDDDEEYRKHEEKQRAMMLNTMWDICDDGVMYAVLPIPEGTTQEEIDAAFAEGEVTLRDGKMVIETHEWEERDGEFYFNSGVKGEVLGEETDPWEKCSGEEEGVLQMMFSKYVRA